MVVAISVSLPASAVGTVDPEEHLKGRRGCPMSIPDGTDYSIYAAMYARMDDMLRD